MNPLTTIRCACGCTAVEVIAAEAGQRQGWYCDNCKNYIKAIGRERYLDASHFAKGAGRGK